MSWVANDTHRLTTKARIDSIPAPGAAVSGRATRDQTVKNTHTGTQLSGSQPLFYLSKRKTVDTVHTQCRVLVDEDKFGTGYVSSTRRLQI